MIIKEIILTVMLEMLRTNLTHWLIQFYFLVPSISLLLYGRDMLEQEMDWIDSIYVLQSISLCKKNIVHEINADFYSVDTVINHGSKAIKTT